MGFCFDEPNDRLEKSNITQPRGSAQIKIDANKKKDSIPFKFRYGDLVLLEELRIYRRITVLLLD